MAQPCLSGAWLHREAQGSKQDGPQHPAAAKEPPNMAFWGWKWKSSEVDQGGFTWLAADGL